MYRACRNIRSPLLSAAAMLAAIGLAAILSSGIAVACTGDAAASSAGPCLDRGWTPILVQLRKESSYLDAKRFAARIKRHLGRGFTERKQQFERHQAQIERQRRAVRRSKARSKARQFAAARRHAHQHAPKHRHALGAKLKRFGFRKLRHTVRPAAVPSGSSAQHAVHWRSLWRHGARNDALPQPSD